MKSLQSLLILIIALLSCAPQKRVSTIESANYDERKNKTEYIVLPYGTVSITGKWNKSHYNTTSKQQFFDNEENVSIAIAFNPIESYEFNTDKSKKGYHFTTAFYEWDSDYLVKTKNLSKELIESDEQQNYVVWRVFGINNNSDIDTYFLFGEKNGNASNFSITKTDKWTREQKINFLKEIYLKN